ncbi:hypothetical protein [Streptococcus parasuis]|uniref:Bacteriocin immunity protein n=1 Tax=Streptococcus parasuis TaxID=1501662 RepID=A0ABV2EUM0_9STRE|nr:hypothetical protein [Streptococcus parasuis]BCP60162.1 hypothetical protein SUT286_14880 [Streptococcus parasuis]
MKIAEKDEFYDHLSAAYNLSQEAFSEALREKMLEVAGQLDKEENLYILAGYLSRFINAELTALTCRAPKELVQLARYLQELQNHYRYASIIPGKIE